jgi:hypothetical protein
MEPKKLALQCLIEAAIMTFHEYLTAKLRLKDAEIAIINAFSSGVDREKFFYLSGEAQEPKRSIEIYSSRSSQHNFDSTARPINSVIAASITEASSTATRGSS